MKYQSKPALLALIATAVHITLIFKSKWSHITVVSLHWNKNVAIWRNFRHWLHRKFIFTSHNAAADDDIVNMTTIPFQLMNVGPNFSDTNLQPPQYPGADGSSCRGSWAVTTIFRGLLQHILPDANYAWVHQLKAKYRQFDNFVVIGGTVSCHYDNWWCHQWRHSYQIDQLFSVSLMSNVYRNDSVRKWNYTDNFIIIKRRFWRNGYFITLNVCWV